LRWRVPARCDRQGAKVITKGRRKKEEGRRKKEEGRRKKEEGRRSFDYAQEAGRMNQAFEQR
jgi:hypothetical protein